MTVFHFDVQDKIDAPYRRLSDQYFSYSLKPENYFFNDEVEVISIFIHSRISPDILKFFPRLKKIICRSVGTDHVDREFCVHNGIEICSIPGYGPHVIATHAVWLFLMGARKLLDSVLITRSGSFSYDIPWIIDLAWKTVGVIWTGRIGQQIISMLLPLGVKILAHDLFPQAELEEKMSFRYASFGDILQKSDFIILACNASEENKNMINSTTISLMKQWIWLVNIARGSLIDEDALIENQNKFSFVALDVVKNESLEWISKISHLDNFFITPHVAFLSDVTVKTIWETTYNFI